MVADTADGADGVVGSVLAHGRYPDGPRSQPPLAAEDDLNPERAKRGLCPTQPASEARGLFRPARPGPSGTTQMFRTPGILVVEQSGINRGKIQGRIAKLGPKYDEIINKRQFHKGF